MINKVYEVIEAKKIFKIPYKKIKILINPNSYIHCLLKFNNGLTKLIAHDTTMRIPIFNTLYKDSIKVIKSNEVDISKLNNLNLNNVDEKKYPMIKILNMLPQKESLFETVLVSSNDELVDQFLNKKIGFMDIYYKLNKFLKKKNFINLKKNNQKKLRILLN